MLLLAILLRLALVFYPEPFWYDEAFSHILATLPVTRLLAATAGDVHPPLYYLLLAAWTRVCGESVAATRALALVLSLVALVLFRDVLTGLPARVRRYAWLLALFLPGLVHHSAEARMYMLLACYVLAALVILRAPFPARDLWGNLARAFIAGVLCAGACLTHNAGALYCVVIALAVFVRDPARWSVLSVAGGTALCLWLVLWGEAFFAQLRAVDAAYWIWTPNLGTLAYTVYSAVFPSGHIPPGVDALLMLLLVPVLVLGTRRAEATARVLALGVPVLAFVIARAGAPSVLMYRVLVPGLFFACIPWAYALTRRDVGRALTVLTVVALVYVNGLTLLNGRLNDDTGTSGALALAPGDVIYAANRVSIPLPYYGDAPIYVLPESTEGGMNSGLSDATLAALGIEQTGLEYLAFNRAWLLWLRQADAPAPEAWYVDALVRCYHGDLAASFDAADGSLKGELWLLYP